MIRAAVLIKLAILLLSSATLFGEGSYTFSPPSGWDQAVPSLLAPGVEVSFFTSSTKEFRPSINLATEKTPTTLQAYLKSVQKIYESSQKNRWRNLGSLKMEAGTATLTAIDMETEAGQVRLFQAFLLHQGTTYILTAAALVEDFPQYQQQFLDAFHSFSLNSP